MPAASATATPLADPIFEPGALRHSHGEVLHGERRLHAIFAALPAGVVALDGKGRVSECNPAAVALLGAPLLGERWRTVIERAFDPRAACSPDVALRSGRVVSIETTPIGGHAGQLLMFKDVTEKRLLQSRLGAQERAITLGKVAASLAHQIRTPVSAALLYAATLRETALDEAERARFVEKIHERLDHVETLTRQMLSYVRGPRRSSATLDVPAVLRQAVESVDAKLAPACVRAELRVAPDLPAVTGSAELLVTALFNLVLNAVQAGGPDTRVVLEAAPGAGGGVLIEVCDDGPGIPRELHEHVIEPFFTTRADGNGLGLAVARDVAATHGGELTVRSRPGAGTRIGLHIAPHRKADGHAAAGLPAAPARDRRHGSGR